MVSTNMERCRMPRPKTVNLSAESVSSTRRARFFSVSLYKRSRNWRDVTYLPSRPKNGESLLANNMLIVGSSTLMVLSGSGSRLSHTVSPMSNDSSPSRAQISPAITGSLVFSFARPSKRYNSLMVDFIIVPSLFATETTSPAFMLPRVTLPIAIRPVYDE